MMTCVSDRSGSASSGVEMVACMPQAASRTVAIRTKKGFWIDQRMREAGMSVHLGTREVVERAAQIRLRVDEELPRCDDGLSQVEPPQNLGAPAVLGADANDGRAKVGGIIGDDHDAARAGLDHRLGGHGQHRFLRGPTQMSRRKHPGPQMLAGIVDHYSDL